MKNKRVKNSQTRSQFLISVLKRNKSGKTCQQLTNIVRIQEGLSKEEAYYLSGSVSTKLRALVVAGILKYSDKKGIKGGHIYQYKSENDKRNLSKEL